MSFEDDQLGTPEDSEQERQRIKRNIEIVRTIWKEQAETPVLTGNPRITPRIFFRKVVKESDMLSLSPEEYSGFFLQIMEDEVDPQVIVGAMRSWVTDSETGKKTYFQELPMATAVPIREMEEIAVLQVPPEDWESHEEF